VILYFFPEGEHFVAFLDGNGLFWKVVGGKSFLFSDFCRLLAILTFLVHFHFALWAFLAIFRYF